jgi:hypothetical protein
VISEIRARWLKDRLFSEYKKVALPNINYFTLFIVCKIYLLVGIMAVYIVSKLDAALAKDFATVLHTMFNFELIFILFIVCEPIIYNFFVWLKKKNGRIF